LSKDNEKSGRKAISNTVIYRAANVRRSVSSAKSSEVTFLSPEQQLVFRSAQLHQSSKHLEQIKACLGERLDWQAVIKIAARHSVLPLVFLTMKHHFRNEIPENIYLKFERIFLLNTGRAVQAEHQIRLIVDSFAEKPIPLIVYKGPVLAKQIYGQISCRSFVDIDLLIRTEDIDAAYQILSSMGFECSTKLHSAEFATLYRYAHHLQFYHAKGKMLVELHWDIVQRNRASTVSTALLFERRHFLQMDDWKCPVLHPHDLLFVLAIHGAKHSWSDLKWICDMRHLLLAYPALKWHDVITEAKEKGVWRRLLCALELDSLLFDAPLPYGIKVSRRNRPLLAHYVRNLLNENDHSSFTLTLERAFYNLISLDNWRDRITLLYYKITPRVHRRSFFQK
jgi:hypothetical protein